MKKIHNSHRRNDVVETEKEMKFIVSLNFSFAQLNSPIHKIH